MTRRQRLEPSAPTRLPATAKPLSGRAGRLRSVSMYGVVLWGIFERNLTARLRTGLFLDLRPLRWPHRCDLVLDGGAAGGLLDKLTGSNPIPVTQEEVDWPRMRRHPRSAAYAAKRRWARMRRP